MNCFLTLDRVFKTSRCFGFSTRSLGHVMFSFAGTAQEAGAGGRSGAAGIPVHGSLMERFSLCIYGFLSRKTSRDQDF